MRCCSQLKSGCSVSGSQGPSSTPSLPPVQDWSSAKLPSVWQQCAWGMRLAGTQQSLTELGCCHRACDDAQVDFLYAMADKQNG